MYRFHVKIVDWMKHNKNVTDIRRSKCRVLSATFLGLEYGQMSTITCAIRCESTRDERAEISLRCCRARTVVRSGVKRETSAINRDVTAGLSYAREETRESEDKKWDETPEIALRTAAVCCGGSRVRR